MKDRQFRAEYHRMSGKRRRIAIRLDVLKGLLVEAMSGPAGPSVTRRELFALPARLGCLGIIDPTKCLQRQFNASARLSEPLTTLYPAKE